MVVSLGEQTKDCGRLLPSAPPKLSALHFYSPADAAGGGDGADRGGGGGGGGRGGGCGWKGKEEENWWKRGKKGERDYEKPQEIRREEQMRTGNRLYGSRTRSKTGFHLRHPAFTVWASRHIYNIGHIQHRYIQHRNALRVDLKFVTLEGNFCVFLWKY